jgi:hypothetical protein
MRQEARPMHRFEIEQLATALYEEFDLNPALPPGLFRVLLRAWGGSAALRYAHADACNGRALIRDDGWVLLLPHGTKDVELNLCFARALALWFLDRSGLRLGDGDIEDFAWALLVPLPALRHEVLVKGLGARDVASIYNVPLELAIARVRRLLDHGSGERPSVTDALTKLV